MKTNQVKTYRQQVGILRVRAGDQHDCKLQVKIGEPTPNPLAPRPVAE